MLPSLNSFGGLSAADIVKLFGANSPSSHSKSQDSAHAAASTNGAEAIKEILAQASASKPAAAIKTILSEAQRASTDIWGAGSAINIQETLKGVSYLTSINAAVLSLDVIQQLAAQTLRGSAVSVTAEAASQVGGSSSLVSTSATISSPSAVQQIADAVALVNKVKIYLQIPAAPNDQGIIDYGGVVTATAADAVNMTVSNGTVVGVTAMQGSTLPSELPSLKSIEQAYNLLKEDDEASQWAGTFDGNFTLIKLPPDALGASGGNIMTFSATGDGNNEWALVLPQSAVGAAVSGAQTQTALPQTGTAGGEPAVGTDAQGADAIQGTSSAPVSSSQAVQTGEAQTETSGEGSATNAIADSTIAAQTSGALLGASATTSLSDALQQIAGQTQTATSADGSAASATADISSNVTLSLSDALQQIVAQAQAAALSGGSVVRASTDVAAQTGGSGSGLSASAVISPGTIRINQALTETLDGGPTISEIAEAVQMGAGITSQTSATSVSSGSATGASSTDEFQVALTVDTQSVSVDFTVDGLGPLKDLGGNYSVGQGNLADFFQLNIGADGKGAGVAFNVMGLDAVQAQQVAAAFEQAIGAPDSFGTALNTGFVYNEDAAPGVSISFAASIGYNTST